VRRADGAGARPAVNVVDVGYDSTNYYVLGRDDNRLLVDVGMPGTLPRLLANLRRKDVPLRIIRHLLVTHFHPDHAGIAQELKREGVRLIVLDVQRAAVPTLNRFLKRRGGSAEITLRDNVDLRIDESRAFLVGLGIAGEIVPTPGHSHDSITLVLDEGIGFTGDLTPPDFAPDAGRDAVALSWRRLRELGVARVYPGHGPPRPIPAAAAQES
jgi:glyoxylase-like metal-dependent hydrolase (beta-lactamase superfamily II)